MPWRPATLIACTSTPPTAWRGATPTRCCSSTSSTGLGLRLSSSIDRSASRRRTICCCRSRAWWPSTSGPRSWSAAGAASATPHARARSACCRARPMATAMSVSETEAVWPATRSWRTRLGSCDGSLPGSAASASAPARPAGVSSRRASGPAAASRPGIGRPCGASSGTPPMRERRPSARPGSGPCRPRWPRGGGGGKHPRRAHGVYDVAPGEWISVPVPPLVEEELFEAAREQLAENRRRNRQHAHGQRYLLQGLIKCQQCGYAYYGKAISLRSAKGKRRAYAYYRCCGSDADRFGGERLCANPQVRTDRLDEAVWREVERVLQDPSWIAAEYERRLDQARDPTTVNLAGIEAQIAKLRRGMGRLIDGYAEGLIDKADFEPRVAGLRQRIKSWDEQATTLRDEVAQRAALSLIVGRLQDFVRQVRDRMSAVDWSLQRDLIRVLVKRVEIDRGEINVVLRVTPSFDPGYGGSQDDRSLHHRGRGDHRSLPCPRLTDAHDPVLQDPRVQPFPDQADDARVADAVVQETEEPFLAHRVEERPDVGVQDGAHLGAGDPDRERIERVVRPAPGPEAIREPEEVLLVDRVQHRRRGP